MTFQHRLASKDQVVVLSPAEGATSSRRVLVISERLPRPDESGGSQRLLAILTLLARHHEIDLWVERDERTGWSRWPAGKIAEDRTRLADIGLSVLPAGWRSLDERMANPRYDVVLFEFHQMAARYARFVRNRQPGIRVIVDSVDVHFARLAGGADLGLLSRDAVSRARRAEVEVYQAADAVIVASDDDERLLADEPGLPPLFCIPSIASVRPRSNGARECVALFVGHFHHEPNLDALRWFVRQVWPLVRGLNPASRLDIIGSRTPPEVRTFGSQPGIRVLGYVPDVSSHLDRAAVAIAPLRYGAGMKGKVTEAMAAGVPVVTTTIGAQGLNLVHGDHALIADDAESFASAVAQLIGNPLLAERIGLTGQRHVHARCSPDQADGALRAMIDDTVRRPPRPRVSPATTFITRLVDRVRRWRLALEHTVRAAARRQAHWLSPDSEL